MINDNFRWSKSSIKIILIHIFSSLNLLKIRPWLNQEIVNVHNRNHVIDFDQLNVGTDILQWKLRFIKCTLKRHSKLSARSILIALGHTSLSHVLFHLQSINALFYFSLELATSVLDKSQKLLISHRTTFWTRFFPETFYWTFSYLFTVVNNTAFTVYQLPSTEVNRLFELSSLWFR